MTNKSAHLDEMDGRTDFSGMSRTQIGYLVQDENTKRRYDLDEILDINKVEERDQTIIPKTYLSRRVYGVKDNELIKITDRSDYGVRREKIGRHPVKQGFLDIGMVIPFFAAPLAVVYAIAVGANYLINGSPVIEGTEYLLGHEMSFNSGMGITYVACAGVASAFVLPSAIRETIRDTKTWKKFKNLKMKGGNEGK